MGSNYDLIHKLFSIFNFFLSNLKQNLDESFLDWIVLPFILRVDLTFSVLLVLITEAVMFT